MSSNTVHTTTLVTALGAGLTAGVFFAFSSFVMPALNRLPARGSVDAMNSINKLAVTPAFMTLFIDRGPLCRDRDLGADRARAS